jgi:uncharacterized membrane protein
MRRNLSAASRFVNWHDRPFRELFRRFHEGVLARQSPTGREGVSDPPAIERQHPMDQAMTAITPDLTATTAPSAARKRSILPNIVGTLAAMLILVPLGFWLRPEDGINYQTPAWAVYIHLATVIPALPLGAWVLWSRKGTPAHKAAGRLWALMMMITAIDSFWIRSMTGGIGPIHIFAVITLWSIPKGIWLARKGDIEGHIAAMRGVYIGLVIAGAFAMLPGRLIFATVFE